MFINRLVRLLDNRSNHFLPSLYLLQKKLADLGIVLANNNAA